MDVTIVSDDYYYFLLEEEVGERVLVVSCLREGLTFVAIAIRLHCACALADL